MDISQGNKDIITCITLVQNLCRRQINEYRLPISPYQLLYCHEKTLIKDEAQENDFPFETLDQLQDIYIFVNC